MKNGLIDGEIRKNRSATAEVTVLTDNKRPLANRELMIAQTNHKFLFGINGFDICVATSESAGDKKELADRRVEKLAALFNFVTLPFYWGRFEPQKERPITDSLKKAAEWCRDHHLLAKGHPLCWHTLTADWLLPLSNREILQAQVSRIRREVSDFRGLIDTWDVVNEAVIMPIFDKYDNGITRICKEMGRIETIRIMFDTARETSPTATLLLNDFDISPAYDILVEAVWKPGSRSM